MPLYDWRCQECEHEWEEMWSSSVADNDTPTCPMCESDFVKKFWSKMPSTQKEYNPYDALDRPIPDGKRIFSGPKVSSK